MTNIDDQTPRVAVFSVRNLDRHLSRSHAYEFEGVIQQMERTTVWAPSHSALSTPMVKAKNWLSYRNKMAAHMPTGLNYPSMAQEHDIFFMSCAHLRDLNLLDCAGEWRKKSRFAVAWVQELWINAMDDLGALVNRLDQFDLVVCSFVETTSVLQEMLNTKVIYEPWGVDVLKFAPRGKGPARAIDAMSVGVRHPSTHDKLVQYYNANGGFYLYETTAGRAEMPSTEKHRENFIGQIQRAQFFFSYIAKIDRAEERGEQVEFGLRYLEAAAAGAILLGDVIDSDAFERHLGWEDAVFPFAYNCPDPGAVIDDLLAQPERIEAARLRNIEQCLLRHDHLYRWELILEEAGLAPTEAMAARRQKIDLAIAQLRDQPVYELVPTKKFRTGLGQTRH